MPINKALSDPAQTDITHPHRFNLSAVLRGQAASAHTLRAYARWIDRYLADLTGLERTVGQARRARLENLPLDKLLPTMTPSVFRAWLGRLLNEDQGKQALNQARASIVTLASLLAEAGILDDYTSAGMSNVKVPKAESGQRQGRWLSVEQVRELMRSAEAIGNTPAQRVRNSVLIRMLCIMALRREELTNVLWQDFHTQAGRPVLLVHGKGSKAALVDVPPVVLRAIENWRQYVGDAPPDSHLIRRIYKSGRVGASGLSVDAIWRIVKEAALYANLGRVAPHDLRRSVAGNLELSGVPVETISRLLRHSSIAVTQHYLSKLPRENEGALLMADLLNFEDETDLYGS